MRAEELERAGMSADAARREALRGFGNFDATRRELARSGQRGERQTRWRTMLEDCWRDVRYGARSLARSPGFTAVAVLVLAVGIGANSATFSLVNLLVMKPTLIANADDVVAIYAQKSQRGSSGFSYPEYTDLRDLNRAFSDLAAFTLRDVGLADGGMTRRVRADFVSTNYFRTLGVPVAQGRDFTATEERAGGDAPVAIVSHALWVRHGRDPAMLGSLLRINAESVAVVGIAAEGFTGHFPAAPELWLPLGLVERFGRAPGESARLDDRENRGLPTLFGRIATDFSSSDVATDLDVLAERSHAQYPPSDGDRQSYFTTPPPRFSIGNAPDSDEERNFMAVLAAVLTSLSGIVLLIACINLANMFLARGAGRRTEIAIRQALGGGRMRLVRQLLVEGLLLALAGGAAGLLCAYWAVRALLSSLPTTLGIGGLQPETLDVRLFRCVTLVSCVATLLFGLGPAWRISGGVAATLKESAGGYVATTSRTARALLAPRNLLIVTQVALSLALLTAGGLFLRSSVEAGRATPGFALEPIALAELDPSLVGYDEPRSREVLRQALERARSLPGVESASLASLVPLDGTSVAAEVQAAGAEKSDRSPIAFYYVIANDYFKTLALPMLAGRTFTAAEAFSAGGFGCDYHVPLARTLRHGPSARQLHRVPELDAEHAGESCGDRRRGDRHAPSHDGPNAVAARLRAVRTGYVRPRHRCQDASARAGRRRGRCRGAARSAAQRAQERRLDAARAVARNDAGSPRRRAVHVDRASRRADFSDARRARAVPGRRRRLRRESVPRDSSHARDRRAAGARRDARRRHAADAARESRAHDRGPRSAPRGSIASERPALRRQPSITVLTASAVVLTPRCCWRVRRRARATRIDPTTRCGTNEAARDHRHWLAWSSHGRCYHPCTRAICKTRGFGGPMRTKYRVLLLTICIVPLAHVAAHHSPAMLYDLSKEISVTGVVTEYQLGNPHMRIYLDVNNNGTIEKWLARAQTQLMRVSWTGRSGQRR
jgi:predicted permease